MRKIHPKLYQGREYIQLSKLPFDQMISLKNWLSDSATFTIPHQDGATMTCVYYEDYEFWFDNYKSEKGQAAQSIF